MTEAKSRSAYFWPHKSRLAILIILGVLAPIAVFLAVRVPMGCSVINPLGLPWPAPTNAIVASLVVAFAALIAVVRGFFHQSTRVVSIVFVGLWLAQVPAIFFLVFITIYGDPGPTCFVR